MSTPWKPTRAQLLAAATAKVTVPDLVAAGLKVLFVGINPGLYSGAVGHHFARPGNRFWPALHAGGFTPRLLSPFDEAELLPLGYGITNLVERATALADELSRDELREGGRRLEEKAARLRPRTIAILGVGAFRDAFAEKNVTVGPQERKVSGIRVWVLPNSSGLNAHYQPADLARIFRKLHDEVSEPAPR